MNRASENFAKLSLMWTCGEERREIGQQPFGHASGAHVLETATVGGETLVERDGEALVVLPVGYAGWDHPLLLLLRGGLARRATQNGRRRARRPARDLLVLETRWLERVFDDIGHLDDALLESAAFALLAGGVADEGGVAPAVWNVLGLGRLDLCVCELFESCACASTLR